MSRKVFDSNELAELDRIATATERIADALEELGRLLNASSKNTSSISVITSISGRITAEFNTTSSTTSFIFVTTPSESDVNKYSIRFKYNKL